MKMRTGYTGFVTKSCQCSMALPSERLAIRIDIRTRALTFKHIRRFIGFQWSVPDTMSNHFITKVFAKQSFTKELSLVKFGLALIAFLNQQRRTNVKAHKRWRKCKIIVMVSHCIRPGQNIEWRQDNQSCITLRGTKTIIAKMQ